MVPARTCTGSVAGKRHAWADLGPLVEWMTAHRVSRVHRARGVLEVELSPLAFLPRGAPEVNAAATGDDAREHGMCDCGHPLDDHDDQMGCLAGPCTQSDCDRRPVAQREAVAS